VSVIRRAIWSTLQHPQGSSVPAVWHVFPTALALQLPASMGVLAVSMGVLAVDAKGLLMCLMCWHASSQLPV
jgi:hypothetical protein